MTDLPQPTSSLHSPPLARLLKSRVQVAFVAVLSASPTAFGVSPELFGEEKFICGASAVFMAKVVSAKCVEKHSPSFPGAEFERLKRTSFCGSSNYEVKVEDVLVGAAIRAGESISFVAPAMATQTILIPTEEAAESRVVGKVVLFALNPFARAFDSYSRERALATLTEECAKLDIVGSANRVPLTPAPVQR